MRFVMSRFVSSNQPRGNVNYEELIKFLAKCLGENINQPPPQPQAPQPQSKPQFVQPRYFLTRDFFVNSKIVVLKFKIISSPRGTNSDNYDPDEQAILRLMHENMRDWDMVNLIDIDRLRKQFYEKDPYNRYILLQREVNL